MKAKNLSIKDYFLVTRKANIEDILDYHGLTDAKLLRETTGLLIKESSKRFYFEDIYEEIWATSSRRPDSPDANYKRVL